MPPNISTERLRIASLRPGDASALFEYRNTEQVAAFQSWIPASVEAARKFIDGLKSVAFNQADTWYQLAIRSASTDELVGDLGVHFVDKDGQQVEIGFTVAPAHHRQGFATEAVVALLDYLFTTLGKHRVSASADPRNTASLALLAKVGMRREAHFRQSLFWKGEWVDDVVYAILRTEWLKRAEQNADIVLL